MTPRTLLAAVAVTVLTVTPTGCDWFGLYDGPMIEGDDVEMDPPEGNDSFRSSGKRGEVYELAQETATDCNEWVTETVEGMAEIVATLGSYPEDDLDDGWRIYGPYNDEEGGDLSFLIKINGDDKSSGFEVWLGKKGARRSEMDAIMWGNIGVAGSARTGGFALDFDAMNGYDDLKEPEDRDSEFGGIIEVNFDRDVDTDHRYVDIDFKDFFYNSPEESVDFTDEAYAFHREHDGSGFFHFAVRASFEEEQWSGPQLERAAVDLRWDETEQGRARATIEQLPDSGDLRYGDLALHECFDARGSLTYRDLTKEYAQLEPGYNFGDEGTCVFSDADLGAPTSNR